MSLKKYGSSIWNTLHYISFGYPDNPSDQDKKNIKNFFISLSYVFPCKKCEKSYQEYLYFNDDVLKNKNNLTYWLYELHKKINRKIGIYYDISFDDLKNKFINNEELYFTPCISYQNAKIMIEYSKIINFDIEDLFIKVMNLKKYSKNWLYINKIKYKIYENIKNKKIITIKNNLPTLYELLLIGLNSTSLNITEIININNKIKNYLTFSDNFNK